MTTRRPDGWPAVLPRLFSPDPEGLVRFLIEVFDATGEFIGERPAEMRIDDAVLLVGRDNVRGATSGFMYVYVDDVDTVFQRALSCGAEVIEAPQDLPYGDRRATVRDPFGNHWQIATHQPG